MAPTTRHSLTKVTSNVKYSSVSSENSLVGKNSIFSKRKAENSPPKIGNLKRAALYDLTNNGKTQKVKSILKNDKKLASIPEKCLKAQVKDESSLVSKNRNSRPVTGLRLPAASNMLSSTLTKGPTVLLSDITKTCQSITSIKNTVSHVKTTRKTVIKSENKPIPSLAVSKLTSQSKIASTVNRTKISGSIDKVQDNSKKVQPVPKKVNNVPKKGQTTITAFQDASNSLHKNVRVTRSSFQCVKEEKPVEITAKAIQEPQIENVERPARRSSTRLREALEKAHKKSSLTNEAEVKEENESCITRSSLRPSLSRKSLTADKTTESNSLYISALEDVGSSSPKELGKTVKKNFCDALTDFDKELLHDPHQVSLYAAEIFQYLKDREAHFAISDYMPKFQKNINEEMRAILVDWMVEVQENFELNHETLYLSVKIVDTYMDKAAKIEKEILQLVAITALFVACKYDERLSPALEDFVYICDGAYAQSDILAMEQTLLKSVNFELSFPISYSFLRRYARCVRVQMPLLTLARYILELSLMEYATVTISDSKLAAAALYLAFRMTDHNTWTDVLTQYTGYKLTDIKDVVLLLNGILHKPESKKLMAIKTKYSNEVFFKVAETATISDDELKKNIDLHS